MFFSVKLGSQLVKARLFGHIRTMMLWLIVIGSALLAFPLQAEQVKFDSLVVGSRIYSNVTVIGANTTDLYFKHSQGIANVKLKYLNKDLQKRFEYDPQAAAEAEQKQAQDDARYAEGLRLGSQGEPNGDTNRVRSSETSLADPVSERSLLGKPAPALEMEKWLGEKPEMEGKFVLVSFWAPWSIPCRKAIPALNALQKKFAKKLVIIGVAAESETELARLSEPKLEFASGIDAKRKLLTAAEVTSVPSVLLVDPKGFVRFQGHPGAITESLLEKLMSNGKATSPVEAKRADSH